MIKLRIEFLNEEERQRLKEALSTSFEILEEGIIKKSKQPNNKFMIQYLMLVIKDNHG